VKKLSIAKKPNTPFARIEDAIAEFRAGRMVIVVDDADRENEGDLILAAEFITPGAVNFMAKHARGLICVPMTSERLQQLGIERMVRQNRESFKTDFQISVDAARGISSGISAADRAEFQTITAALLTRLREQFAADLPEDQRGRLAQTEAATRDPEARLLAGQVFLARNLPDYWQRLERYQREDAERYLAEARRPGWLKRLFGAP